MTDDPCKASTGIWTREQVHDLARDTALALGRAHCVVVRPIQPLRWQVFSQEYVEGALARGDLLAGDVEATYQPRVPEEPIVDPMQQLADGMIEEMLAGGS